MAPIRKPKLQYSNDNLLEAIAEVKMRTLSTREAANKYGVPQSTIMDRIKGRYAPEPLKSGIPMRCMQNMKLIEKILKI